MPSFSSSPSQASAAVVVAVSAFGAEIAPRLLGDGAGKEDRIRGPLEILVKAVAAHAGVQDLVLLGEESLSALRVRPDYQVEVGGALTGHVEVKSPGKGADPTKWTGASAKHDREQWEKLSRLPNVLYTDGGQFALYRSGVRVGEVVSLVGDVTTAGSALAPARRDFEDLLVRFLAWAPTPPTSVDALVASAAGLCRLLRAEVLESMRASKDSPLHRLHAGWSQLLFPDATDESFADQYAQSVTFSAADSARRGHRLPSARRRRRGWRRARHRGDRARPGGQPLPDGRRAGGAHRWPGAGGPEVVHRRAGARAGGAGVVHALP